MEHIYKIGDCVIVETKHYGPYYGHVGAVDPDGSIVVRHNVHRYPEHPSGATYVDAKNLAQDVTRYGRVEVTRQVNGIVTHS